MNIERVRARDREATSQIAGMKDGFTAGHAFVPSSVALSGAPAEDRARPVTEAPSIYAEGEYQEFWIQHGEGWTGGFLAVNEAPRRVVGQGLVVAESVSGNYFKEVAEEIVHDNASFLGDLPQSLHHVFMECAGDEPGLDCNLPAEFEVTVKTDPEIQDSEVAGVPFPVTATAGSDSYIVEMFDPGVHTKRCYDEDNRGRVAAPGLYFVRMQASEFSGVTEAIGVR